MEVLVELTIVAAMIAFVGLLGVLVSTIIQVKKTLVQAEHLLEHLNKETPLLLDNLHEISHNVRGVTHQTRLGITHAMVLGHAIGDIGDTVKRMHVAVLDQGERLFNTFDAVTRSIKSGFEPIPPQDRYETKTSHVDDQPKNPLKSMAQAYLVMVMTRTLTKLIFGEKPERNRVRQP
ncbi:MAG: hypothetical protein NPIRA01_00370 [Nitrospirales bacterium]|nr:MAG: hypothetical protein NPIRA01_00370 [Nitrospirales bacterium]